MKRIPVVISNVFEAELSSLVQAFIGGGQTVEHPERPALPVYDPWSCNKAGIALAYGALFIAAYLPVIVGSFGFLDDYTILAEAMRHQMSDVIQQSTSYGRPLYALLMQLAMPQIHGVAGLNILRTGGVLGIAVLALMLCRHVSRARLPPSVSLALPAALGLMPPFQVYAAWAITAVLPLAGVLGGLAFAVLGGSPEAARPLSRLRPLVALALLAAALSIYQPAAMVFWVFAAITLIGRDGPINWRRLAVAAGVMAAALAADFALSKLAPQLLWHSGAAVARTALVKDFGGKLVWFVSEPLRDALNLPFIQPRTIVAAGVACFTAVGLWLYWPGSIKARSARLLVAAALVPATYLPNLLVAENWASYRTQVALTSLLLVYAALAFVGWLRVFHKAAWLPAVMAAMTALCVLLANRNVMLYFVIPQSIEYRLFERALADLHNPSTPEIKRLDFYTARRWSLTDFARYDEFGLLSNSAAWVPPAMAWLILSSQGSPLADLPMQVVPRGMSPVTPGSQLIDLDVVMFGSTH